MGVLWTSHLAKFTAFLKTSHVFQIITANPIDPMALPTLGKRTNGKGTCQMRCEVVNHKRKESGLPSSPKIHSIQKWSITRQYVHQAGYSLSMNLNCVERNGNSRAFLRLRQALAAVLRSGPSFRLSYPLTPRPWCRQACRPYSQPTRVPLLPNLNMTPLRGESHLSSGFYSRRWGRSLKIIL